MQKELKETAAKGDSESQLRLAEMQKQLKRLSDQLAKLDDSIYLSKELENKMGLSEEDAKKLLDKLSKMDPKQLEKELQQQMSQKGASEKQIKDLVKKIQQQREAKKTCQNMGQCLAQAAQAVAAGQQSRQRKQFGPGSLGRFGRRDGPTLRARNVRSVARRTGSTDGGST